MDEGAEQGIIRGEADTLLADPVDRALFEADAQEGLEVGPNKPDPATLVTAEDIESARVEMLAGDFRAGIEIALKRVSAALHQRREAQTIRGRSQSVFAQGESIMEEAIRSVESASKAYEEGFAASSEANKEATAKVREMAESLKTRKESNQSAYQGVLGQAFGMKEKVTQELIAALDAMNSAVMNVARELEESAKAASTADATKDSAIEQLLAVQAMWNQLASMRQELLARRDPEPGLQAPPETFDRLKRTAAQPETPSTGSRELTSDAVDLLVPGLSGQAIEDQVLDAAGARAEIVNRPVAPKVESLTGDPALDLEIANAQAAADFPGSVGASAAEVLRREMAGLAPLPNGGQPGSQITDPRAEPIQPPAATPEPMREPPSPPVFDPQIVQSLTYPANPAPQPAPDAPASDAPAPPSAIEKTGLARSYRGRIYLMFDASLTQEKLELVWDAVEGASDSGVIVDTRLVSRDEGVQMTLDLNRVRLDVAEFLQRLPGAELEPMAGDRLRVAWPTTI